MFPIDQGRPLSQDQPIFNLPDPKTCGSRRRLMSRRSSCSAWAAGEILVDAFPQKPLNGTVAEINQINTPINGSDVRIYYANVNITDGFADLRPGLVPRSRSGLTGGEKSWRVPIEALRWAGDQAFVALRDPSRDGSDKDAWLMEPIEIGVSDTRFAEVVNGLKVGDLVVASPRTLPAPKPLPSSPRPVWRTFR